MESWDEVRKDGLTHKECVIDLFKHVFIDVAGIPEDRCALYELF